MARKRKASKRRAISPFVRSIRTRARSSNNGASPLKSLGYGFGYGVVRSPVISLLAPVLGQINLGAYENSAAMGVLSYLAVKKGSGMIREIGKAGLYVESAAVGTAMNPLGQVTQQISNMM